MWDFTKVPKRHGKKDKKCVPVSKALARINILMTQIIGTFAHGGYVEFVIVGKRIRFLKVVKIDVISRRMNHEPDEIF